MEELSDAELNALSDEGLQKIANGGKLEDLGDYDLKAIADMQPEDPNQPSWFQENVARPIVDKAADIYGSLSSLSSENIRTEAMNQLLKEGSVTPEEVRSGKVEPGLGNKMAAASEMFLQNAFDVLRVKEGDARTRRTGDVNPQILADMQAMDVMDKSLAEMNVAAMVKGKAFAWGEGNAGILEKLGDTVSTPEQFVARASLGALSGIGALPRKDAIELLSQTQLHGSDLVDYFWIPETAAGKIGRGVLGFAADVAMDPLSYLTFGAGPVLKNIFKEGTVKMGNRVITDPKLLARAERQALLAQNDVVRLIREPGRIQNLEVADEAMNTLSKAVSEKGLQGLDSEIVDRFSRIDPALGEQVASVIRSRQTEKGLLKSLADRETSLNFGFRLPLTNIAIEQQVPLFGHGTRWAAEGALGVKDWAFSSANRVAGSVLAKSEGLQTAARIGSVVGDALSSGYQAMKTFTTRPLWDSSSNKYINKKAGNSNWALRQMDESIKEVGNDPETSDLMVKWLNQMPTHSDDVLIQKFGDDGDSFLSGKVPVVHGSPEDIVGFKAPSQVDPSHRYSGGSYSVFGSDSTYFSEDPYWLGADHPMEKGGRGLNFRNIYKVDLNFDKALVVDPKNMKQVLKKFDAQDAEDLSRKARAAGYDGIITRGFNKKEAEFMAIAKERYPAFGLPFEESAADVALNKEAINGYHEYERLRKEFYGDIPNEIDLAMQDQVVSFAPEKSASGITKIGEKGMLGADIEAALNKDGLRRFRPSSSLRKNELSQARQLADQTMARLEMRNPKAAQRVRLIREQFNSRVAEMEKRGIPFNVLNPFDETIPVEERAMGYFPHILNPDYIDDAGNPKYAAAKTAWEDHQAEMGLIDRTQVGRSDRRSTHTIIDSVKKASGLDKPIFITDPISASYSRIEDMDNIIAQHDLFQEIWPLAVIKRPGGKLGAMSEEYDGPAFKALKASYIDEDPGRGFVKMDWKDYASPVFKKSGGGATMGSGLLGRSLTTDLKAKEYIQFRSFLPPQYKTAIENGATIYFPEDVATRINYVMQREKGGIARQAIDAYGYWFRNSALFGPGYQGMNAFGNLTTHMTARGDLAQIPRASKFLFDAKNNSAKVRGSTYTFGKGAQQISINGEELYDTMAEMGILGGSHTSEADVISDIWDQVATTKSTRDKLKYKAKTLTDRITLFKFNRHLAEQNDNIFRSGLFFDSLEKGYSLEGAKERVGMYFYDFRDMPKGQRAVSKAIPFSSFSMKTLESGVRRAAKLDLTPVTIPHYVGQILDGAFVDSYEERQALKTTLPPYADHYVLGDALPGGRQLLVEAPFVVNSIKSFLNPLDNVHPLIQALAMATTAASQADAPQDPEFEAARLDSETYKSKWDSFLGDQLRQLIPPSIKIPLTIAQMKNPDEVRALPLDFVTPLTAKTFAEASGNTSAAMLTNNAQEFGKFLREHVSPNWFYNALMFGQFKDPYITNKDALGDKDAIFGNFVKSRMRDMSFGLVRMNDMDRAIVTRMAAVQRQILKSTKAMETVNIQANVLRDPLATPKLMKNRLDIGDKKTADLVAELGELYQRNAALSTFYGYYISQQKSGGMAIDMIKNAIQPEKPLTAEEADNQNMLMESAPALEAGRIKSQMLMEGQ